MATSTADAVSPEVEELSNKPKISGGTSEGEESNWTVQSSTKTRRLVPQFSLTRQDMGADNNRGTKAPPEIVKKKGMLQLYLYFVLVMKNDFFASTVVRFTKEELLELRKPANKILPSMSDMLEILSLTTMDPVCFEKLEPEDVRLIEQGSTELHNVLYYAGDKDMEYRAK